MTDRSLPGSGAMDEDAEGEEARSRARRRVQDQRLQHLQQISAFLALGLALSGMAALVAGDSPVAVATLRTDMVRWGVSGGFGATAIGLALVHQKLPAILAWLAYGVFCVAGGIAALAGALSPGPLAAAIAVPRILFVVAATFASIGLYGYTTRTDLSENSAFLIMALFGVILTGLTAIGLGGTVPEFGACLAGIALATGACALRAKAIQRRYRQEGGRDDDGRLVILGVLGILLAVITMLGGLRRLIRRRRRR